MRAFLQGVITAFLSAYCLPGVAQGNEPTEGIRTQMESEFRSVTGLGFKSFQCTYPNGWPGSREILCEAIDDEDDQFFYRLVFETAQGAPRSMMKQPVSQLNPEGLATLSAPSDEFLEAFTQENWDAAYNALSPELQEKLDPAGLQNTLEPLSAWFGGVAGEPRVVYYASPNEGLHQLEYTFATAQGEALGRFRLAIDAEGNPRILAFLLTSQPGSQLQSMLLEETGKTLLAPLLEQPIVSIQGPLESLEYIGDSTEVDVVLEDGMSLKALVEQKSSTYDYDRNDYRFVLLDAGTIIGSHFSTTDQSAETIDCPAEVAPDGGSIECDVTFADGARTRVTLMRRGSEHRLVVAD